ncbi:GntR family transcriptional regulator [Niabella insulamsoli]|uniref:GntR family transcriptional regulator n=1 Tax=Niabella insulamsoli TaxID=3144874 RepID=UPI0031FBB345
MYAQNLNIDRYVNPSSKTFLYLQVKKIIRQAILTGKLEKGVKLPSARDIGKGSVVSLATAERAYRDLRKEGMIVKRKGDGYFVSDALQGLSAR